MYNNHDKTTLTAFRAFNIYQASGKPFAHNPCKNPVKHSHFIDLETEAIKVKKFPNIKPQSVRCWTQVFQNPTCMHMPCYICHDPQAAWSMQLLTPRELMVCPFWSLILLTSLLLLLYSIVFMPTILRLLTVFMSRIFKVWILAITTGLEESWHSINASWADEWMISEVKNHGIKPQPGIRCLGK